MEPWNPTWMKVVEKILGASPNGLNKTFSKEEREKFNKPL